MAWPLNGLPSPLHRAGQRIQQDGCNVSRGVEIEIIQDASGECIERLISDAAEVPVVFDKANPETGTAAPGVPVKQGQR